MKMKKIISTVMAALLAVMVLVQPASAFNGLYLAGQLLGSQATNIGDGFVYKSVKTTDTNGAKQALFYGEYKSSATSQYEWVIHSVTSTSGQVTKNTVLDIAKDYEKKTGKQVIFGTNGDFFEGSGAGLKCVGDLVVDNVIKNDSAYSWKHSIGFDNNGKIVVGQMQPQVFLRLTIDGQSSYLPIDKVNQAPGENQIAVYTSGMDFTVANAVKYKFKVTDGVLNAYPITGQCKNIGSKPIETDTVQVTDNYFYLVGKGKYVDYLAQNISYNGTVELVQLAGYDYTGCSWVLGGYDILVNNGEVNQNCHTDNAGAEDADRTFIGVKEDGTMFLCAIDGRQGASYSWGLYVSQEAQLAKDLGAKWALELDGGGSTTVVLRQNGSLKVMNHSSEVATTGSCRAVYNAILLVEKSERETLNFVSVPNSSTEPDVPETTAPDATTAPDEPTTAPTEPTTAPTEPTTAPNEPTTAPTEPATQPTNPGTEPSDDEGGSTAVVVVAAAVATVSVGGSVGAVVWFILRKKRGV